MARVPSIATGRRPKTRRAASRANNGLTASSTACQIPRQLDAGSLPRAMEKAPAEGGFTGIPAFPKSGVICRMTSRYDCDFFTAHNCIKHKNVDSEVNFRRR